MNLSKKVADSGFCEGLRALGLSLGIVCTQDWLCKCAMFDQRFAVSIAELKNRIAELTVEERLELAALITHLTRKDDPAYQAELARRMAEKDAGKKFDQADLKRLHTDLNSKGR